MAYSVLLVDDSQTMREAVRMTFLQSEFTLTAVATASEGLALAAQIVPQLILVDLRLPELDGYEFCRRIKRDPHTQPCAVLLFAGVSVPQDKARSVEVGALGFFPKPFVTQDLLDQASMICKAAASRALPQGAARPTMQAAAAPRLPQTPDTTQRFPEFKSHPAFAEPAAGRPTPIAAEPPKPLASREAPKVESTMSFPAAALRPTPPAMAVPPTKTADTTWELPEFDGLLSTAQIAARAKAQDSGTTIGEITLESGELELLDEPPLAQPEAKPVMLSDEEAASLLLVDDEEEAEAADASGDRIDLDQQAATAPAAEFEELLLEEQPDQPQAPRIVGGGGLTAEERATLASLQSEAPDERVQPQPAASHGYAEYDPFGLSDTPLVKPAPVLAAKAPGKPAASAPTFSNSESMGFVIEDLEVALDKEAAPQPVEEEEIDFDLDIEPMDEPEVREIPPEVPPKLTIEESVPTLPAQEEPVAPAAPTPAPEEEEEAIEPVKLEQESFEIESISHKAPRPFAPALSDSPLARPRMPAPAFTAPVSAPEAEEEAPDADHILRIFRRAIREEIAASALPGSSAGIAPEELRKVVREELAAMLPQAAPSPAPAELERLVRAAVATELKDVLARTLREVMGLSLDKMDKLIEASKAVPLASGVAPTGAVAPSLGEIEMAVARALSAREAPAALDPEAIARSVAAKLDSSLQGLKSTLDTQAAMGAGLGEEIHTWLNSALSELPSADELRALASGAKTVSGAAPAPGVGPDFAATLREILRDEVGRLAGHKAEAIAWEVIPPLAEVVIKQQMSTRA